MKNFIVILLILVLILSGCEYIGDSVGGSGQIVTTTYDYDDFTKIESNSNFEVVIEQSDSYSVEVTCDDNIVQYLDVQKKGSTLSLLLESPNSYHNIVLKAKISAPDIYKIEGTGSSDISIKDVISLNHDLEIILSGASTLKGTFEADDLEAKLSGSSDISGKITTDTIKLNLSGASKATLEGAAHNIECKLDGSSDANLYDLPVKEVDARLSGASTAKVTVDGFISLDASGSSTLFYKGRGAIKSIELSGDSKIKKAD